MYIFASGLGASINATGVGSIRRAPGAKRTETLQVRFETTFIGLVFGSFDTSDRQGSIRIGTFDEVGSDDIDSIVPRITAQLRARDHLLFADSILGLWTDQH